jgi:hypothetical protein
LAESFSIFCFKAIMRFSLAVDRFNSPVIEFKTMTDYFVSLALKCTNYNTPGGGSNTGCLILRNRRARHN